MTTETELILAAIADVKADVREIRAEQSEQGKSITDLCTRTSMNEEGIKNHVKASVKTETKSYKFISLGLAAITSISTAILYLKQAGLF